MTFNLNGPDKCYAVTLVDPRSGSYPAWAGQLLMRIPATVAVDGALHTTGLPAGFARVLHGAVHAVPLLTMLVRRLKPQHREISSGGRAFAIRRPGNRHTLSITKKSVTRHGCQD